jgi:hypothetical protein
MLLHEAEKNGESQARCLSHANDALCLYQESLAACPESAVNSLGPIHCNLGTLFAELRHWDNAREHYEKSASYAETTNRQGAGITRHNLAAMYFGASQEQRDQVVRSQYLCRAQAYARAALRDFQHYQGRLSVDEAETQKLLDAISQALSTL